MEKGLKNMSKKWEKRKMGLKMIWERIEMVFYFVMCVSYVEASSPWFNWKIPRKCPTDVTSWLLWWMYRPRLLMHVCWLTFSFFIFIFRVLIMQGNGEWSCASFTGNYYFTWNFVGVFNQQVWMQVESRTPDCFEQLR